MNIPAQPYGTCMTHHTRPNPVEKFYITDSFLSHHTNTDTPIWVKSLIKNKKLVWNKKEGTVSFHRDGEDPVKLSTAGALIKLSDGTVTYIANRAYEIQMDFMQHNI